MLVISCKHEWHSALHKPHEAVQAGMQTAEVRGELDHPGLLDLPFSSLCPDRPTWSLLICLTVGETCPPLPKVGQHVLGNGSSLELHSECSNIPDKGVLPGPLLQAPAKTKTATFQSYKNHHLFIYMCSPSHSEGKLSSEF